MAASSKPLGQTYHEEVEALKAKGVSNADAIRQVADKHGKNVNAIRGGIHQYRSRHLGASASGTGRRRRTGGRTVDDFVASARQALQDALSLVDREVDQAKVALDEAQARYEEAVAGVASKKEDIEQKLKALR